MTITNPGDQNSTEGSSPTLTLSGSDTTAGTLVYLASDLPPGLSINPATGVIGGTVGVGDALYSPYFTTVTATDGTYTDSQNFNWNISSAITLAQPADQTSTEGTAPSLSLSASYSGAGSLSYSALGLPPGLTINASTGAITGTVAVADAANGPYYVTVQAAIGATAADQSFNWNINSPITLTLPSDQTNNEGDSVSLSLSATDSDSGTLSYSATGLPPGLKMNASSGVISGTVALGDAAAGQYAVTILAQDGTYSTEQTFNWNVNSPVVLAVPADQTTNESDSVDLTLSATDSTSATLTYAAVGLPPGLVINASSGVISGTVTVGDAANSPYSVTIVAGDSTYSDVETFNWNVNSPITLATPNDQTNNESDSVSLALSATDADSGTLTYSASGLPSGVSLNTSTGVISGTASVGGSWQPTIAASEGAYSESVTFNWAVSSPINITDQGDQFNLDSDTVSLAIGATDNASGTMSFAASGLPSGLSINASSGVITGTIGSSADTASPYTATITVTDGTNTAVDTFAWDVNLASVVLVANPGSQSNAAGDIVVLQIQALDTTGNTLSYIATGLPDGLYLNPNTGLIFGTVAGDAVSGSPYAVTVEAYDLANYSAAQTFSWTVNAAGTVTLTNPGDQTNNEGDSVSVSLTAHDSGAGTLSYEAFGLPPGLKINTGTGTITGTVALDDAAYGPYTVTVMANDGTYSAEQTFNWNVNSPVTLTLPADQTNNEGDSVSMTLSATDSTSATLSYSALGLPPGLTINPSTGVITGTIAVGDAAAGSYSVTVIANDNTYSTTQTFNWNVNSPITINVPDDETNNDGDAVSLTLSASDSATGTLTYSAQGLPPGLAIDPSTGVISGTVIVGDSVIGTFYPTIIVSDGTYSNSTYFEWDVNSVLSITDPGDQANTVGDSVSFTVVASDTNSETLTYAASGLPNGLSINTSTGVISGTITSGATAIGTFTTTITVGDSTVTTTDTFNWTVTGSGVVTLTTPSNQINTEGDSSVSLSLSASDSDSATLKYFAEGLPFGLKINPSTGAITGTVAVNDAAYGSYTVTVIATDGTNSAEETFTWTVNDPVSIDTVADLTYTESDSMTVAISGSGAGADTLTYGAIGLPPGLQINTSTGAITGTVALGDSVNGVYSVTVLATDGTYSAAQTFDLTVNGPVTFTQPVATETYVEGNSVSVSFGAADTSSGTITYTAVNLPPGLTINQSTGLVTGTIAAGAAANGPDTVIITASDGTYSDSETVTWDLSSPISVTNPGVEDYSEGGSVDFFIQASSLVSGTLRYIASALPSGLSINALTGEITGTIANSVAAAGDFVSTVTVTNGSYFANLVVNWVITNGTLGVPTLVYAPTKATDPSRPMPPPVKDRLMLPPVKEDMTPDEELTQDILRSSLSPEDKMWLLQSKGSLRIRREMFLGMIHAQSNKPQPPKQQSLTLIVTAKSPDYAKILTGLNKILKQQGKKRVSFYQPGGQSSDPRVLTPATELPEAWKNLAPITVAKTPPSFFDLVRDIKNGDFSQVPNVVDDFVMGLVPFQPPGNWNPRTGDQPIPKFGDPQADISLLKPQNDYNPALLTFDPVRVTEIPALSVPLTALGMPTRVLEKAAISGVLLYDAPYVKGKNPVTFGFGLIITTFP